MVEGSMPSTRSLGEILFGFDACDYIDVEHSSPTGTERYFKISAPLPPRYEFSHNSNETIDCIHCRYGRIRRRERTVVVNWGYENLVADTSNH